MIVKELFSYFRREKCQKIWLILPLCLGTLSITGCDYINDKLYPDFRAKTTKTPVDRPPFSRKDGKPNISIDKVRDIAANAEEDNNFTVNPVTLNNNIADSKGLNTDQLFANPVDTPEERFARLETQVQRISDTLKKMSPSITKLMGIENELDSLTFQLEELINKGLYVEKEDRIETFEETTQTTEQTMQKGPVIKPVAEKSPKAASKTTYTPPPSKIKAGSLIHTMRIGDHSGKARIVFETTEKLEYTITVDNDEKILTITFPKGNLGSDPAKLAKYSNLFRSISQNENESGATIAFELTQNTEKLKDFRISPDKEISRHRIVIDLKR